MSSCPVCAGGRTLHSDCRESAVEWRYAGRYATDALADTVRRLAPECYLCGDARTEHAEHVRPKAHGGRDRWPNMAGACAPCNLRKAARLTITSRQRARWREQQAEFRDAFMRSLLIDARVMDGYAPCMPAASSHAAQGIAMHASAHSHTRQLITEDHLVDHWAPRVDHGVPRMSLTCDDGDHNDQALTSGFLSYRAVATSPVL